MTGFFTVFKVIAGHVLIFLSAVLAILAISILVAATFFNVSANGFLVLLGLGMLGCFSAMLFLAGTAVLENVRVNRIFWFFPLPNFK